MGVKHLRRIQIGLEGTAGTAVAATATLRASGTIEDQRSVVFPEETIGILGGADRQYTSAYLAQLDTEGEATFEQLPYFLNASINTDTGVTQDVGGSGYIRTYTLPTTAKNAIATYTIEGGDDTEAEEMEYSFVKEFTLSGKYQEAWNLSASWVGRQSSTCSFTAATACPIPDVSELLFGNSKLYIDDSTGTIGTTLVSNTLLAADLKIASGWIPKFTADGTLYFSFIEQVGPEITLDVTFEHNASAIAAKSKWRAGTAQLIKLLIEGPALTTGGAVYSKKTVVVNLAGKWEKFEKIDEIDGNDVLKGTFRVKYNATYGGSGSIIVVNEVATMP